MYDKLKSVQFIGILFTVILGTLLHFTYEWSGNRPFIALFSPVNESVWEHLKLLFVPFLLFSLLEYIFLGEDYPNLMMANSIGLIIGLVFLVVLYYIYTSILGSHFLVLDILIFIISVFMTFTLAYLFTRQGKFSIFLPETGLALLFFLWAIFILFTFNPPMLELFRDPITGTYGALKINP